MRQGYSLESSLKDLFSLLLTAIIPGNSKLPKEWDPYELSFSIRWCITHQCWSSFFAISDTDGDNKFHLGNHKGFCRAYRQCFVYPSGTGSRLEFDFFLLTLSSVDTENWLGILLHCPLAFRGPSRAMQLAWGFSRGRSIQVILLSFPGTCCNY